ncbi:MAG: DUF131 domain-containing protein [Candidatus Bathyarchaeia archaeon]
MGFMFCFLAIILLIIKSKDSKASIKGGGAILIGPIPIVFGTNKEMLKIAIILAIVIIVVFALMSFQAFFK